MRAIFYNRKSCSMVFILLLVSWMSSAHCQSQVLRFYSDPSCTTLVAFDVYPDACPALGNPPPIPCTPSGNGGAFSSACEALPPSASSDMTVLTHFSGTGASSCTGFANRILASKTTECFGVGSFSYKLSCSAGGGVIATSYISSSSCVGTSVALASSTSCSPAIESGDFTRISCRSASLATTPAASSCFPINVPSNAIDLSSRGFQYCQQACPQWCWATVITMVSNFIARRVSVCNLNECSVATFLANRMGFPVNCCFVGCAGCNFPAQPNQISFVLQNVGVHGQFFQGPILESLLQLELANGRPLILGMTALTSGHVIVIYGYSCTALPCVYLVADPWPTSGLRSLSYSSLLTYGGSRWSFTWFGMAADSRCAVIGGGGGGGGSNGNVNAPAIGLIVALFFVALQ